MLEIPPPPPAPPDPELGAVGAPFRLWRAKEAFRQGEMTLTQQSLALDGLRVQATSLLGWSVTIGVALAAAALTTHLPAVAVTVVTSITITAALSIAVLWVTNAWRWPSFNPLQILDHEHKSELLLLESLAVGSNLSIVQNSALIKVRARFLRVAWINFASMPLLAMLAYSMR
ncbi:hypothetical protein HN018_06715 [Lichenicola cladoniae]|uniref:DUF1772 domain-containing protein n=1 Tax=Lichenicola cladoniae TaxID=1484109 RepID=A0A6M8HMY0_9PROT|nr:hypothetical protein [Lichenicola cladoniae]NPD67264.1 hypothetical protein [Acetobacteraceae bacterium]QKE89769.1 hypothetical protein HN018_06715 [Lichenicola cladoniae]